MNWVNLETLTLPRHEAIVALDGRELEDTDARDELYAAWESRDAESVERYLRRILQRFEGVPAGYVIAAVTYDVRTRLTLVVLAHPSFSVVRPGEKLPFLPVVLRG